MEGFIGRRVGPEVVSKGKARVVSGKTASPGGGAEHLVGLGELLHLPLGDGAVPPGR